MSLRSPRCNLPQTAVHVLVYRHLLAYISKKPLSLGLVAFWVVRRVGVLRFIDIYSIVKTYPSRTPLQQREVITVQTAPEETLTHQYLVTRAQDTARAIERLVAQMPPAGIIETVEESTKQDAQEVMGRTFEPFCHAFMSALDVDIDNLRTFMLAVYDSREAIPDVFEQARELHREAHYTRLPYTKKVVCELVPA